jgi:PKD repeat protein
MRYVVRLSVMLLLLVAMAQILSCKKEKEDLEVLASFTYQLDSMDYKKVIFTNWSKNYTTLSWDFGDNSGTSSEANPVHSYTAVGEFMVTLTATWNEGGETTDSYSATVTVADPNAELTKLVGDTAKTWKLIRDVSTGDYPLEVGPIDHSTIWWAVGLNNNELENRPCMLNDEWTFYRNGTMVFNANGDFWREGGIFPNPDDCGSTDDMINNTGEDCSAWGSGTHQFELVNGINPKLKAIGNGAFVGFFKSATEYEVTKLDPMVQDSVVYDVIKLTDGAVDTLIIEANYKFELPDPNPGGYWRYVLVHYDNPDDEPPIPGEGK